MYLSYVSGRLPSQSTFRSNESSSCKAPWSSSVLVRLALLLIVCFPLVARAGDGVRLQDHWKSLGVSATDIELIDKLGLSKSKVEMLITSGVSVREYSHRPWEPMGIVEDQWIAQLKHGSNVGQLERMYSRDRDVTEVERPSLLAALLLPGIPQFIEGRPIAGSFLTGLGISFATLLTINIVNHQGSAIQVWAPLLGADMLASGADVWWNHYRAQGQTGFSLRLQPRPEGMGAALAARF
jgi:hypothetical protein